jgi:Raf kinase inhibitor-like YbhB/YbcL family protein
MNLYSSAFRDGSDIPSEYTCDGVGRIPPLSVSGVPSDAESLVLICHDPDSPSGNFDHWVVYDIPPHVSSIGGRDGTPGKNSWGKLGYGGPCPSNGEHRYIFTLSALSKMLNLKPGASRATVEQQMRGRVIAETSLMGTYIKEENRK